MNPQLPQLTPEQKTQYNRYRAEGLTPEKAISLATKGADNMYNPAIESGVDKILYGKNSLLSSIGGGIKEAVVGGARTIKEDAEKYGTNYALKKAPLSILAGAGRGVGEIAYGAIETADDLVGEMFSDTLMPAVDSAVNSDVGQYLIEKGTEFNEENRGVPGEIIDTLDLVGLTALLKGGTARSIKDFVLRQSKKAVEVGGTTARQSGRLMDYLKPSARTNAAAPIEESLQGIQRVLETKLDQTAVLASLDEIKTALRESPEGLSDRVFAKIEDFDLTPEERNLLQAELTKIEDFLKQDGSTQIVEGYLNGTLDKIDSVSGAAVSVIGGLSDNLIDRGFRTINAVREVPAKLSERAKGAVDRRIVRVTRNSPDQAREAIINLYKKGIVPGVKKKNKTITNIEKINESILRAVPALSKKYDVQDLEDFARVISAEKREIFDSIEAGLKDAGDGGRAVSMQKIIDELETLAKSERAEFSTPLRNAIERARKELVTETPEGEIIIKAISPSGAQDLIADLNAQLQSYYRGSTSGTAADVIVDNLVVNNLRSMVDDVVDDLGEGTFKDLKSRYADLKRMEDDVVHRAVFEAQKGGRLSDLTDITSAADVIAGSLDPAFLARGVAQFMTKEVINSLTDKNELVRQMFLYGKNLDTGPVKKAVVPPTPETKPSTQNGETGFGISPETDIAKTVGLEKMSETVDFKQPLAMTDGKVNLFGTEVPLKPFESSILEKAGVKLETGFNTTKGGRKSAKQPLAVYAETGDKSKKAIRFTPRKGESFGRTLQTFFHEVGHALDSNGLSSGSLRNNGDIFKAMQKEGPSLVRERALRSFGPTIKKFNLDEKQVDAFIRGQRVTLGENKYIPAQKKLARYYRRFDEIFAEAYAMYRVNPEKLRELAPEMYQALDNIK